MRKDLVIAWFNCRRADLAKFLAKGGTQTRDTETRVRDAFRALARLFEGDPRAGRAMVRAWLQAGGPLLTPTSETAGMLADLIRSGQRHGDVRPELDSEQAGQVLFDTYLGVLSRWVNDEGNGSTLHDELLSTLDLVLSGIAPARGGASLPGTLSRADSTTADGP